MRNTIRLLLITYLQCLVFKPSLQSKFTCPLAGRIWWYPPRVDFYMLSIGVPLLLHLCHHVKQCCIISLLNPSIDNHCLQYFNLAGNTFISRWYLRPYQSMPLRWSSFLIIELNYPFQASYQVSAPVSIGRSFNNWAFNSASQAYSFALTTYSKSICCCRLICTCPRQHLQYICSRPCKLLHVNIMATKFWSTSLTSFADIDNTQQLTLMDVSD